MTENEQQQVDNIKQRFDKFMKRAKECYDYLKCIIKTEFTLENIKKFIAGENYTAEIDYKANEDFIETVLNPTLDEEHGIDYDITEREYDEKGNLTKVEVKRGDEVIYVETHEHDEAGNITKIAKDYNGDGNVDYVETHVHVYKEGRLIKSQINNNITEREYDEKGNLTKVEVKRGDEVIYVETHEHDEAGNITKIAKDYNGDGNVDYVETHVYKEGLLKQVEIDNDNDGNIDGVIKCD